LWVVRKTVTPLPLNLPTSPLIILVLRTSNPEVGSSRKRSLGSCIKAIANMSLCLNPLDSTLAFCPLLSVSSNISKSSSALLFLLPFGTPYSSPINIRLSQTDRSMYGLDISGTIPIDIFASRGSSEMSEPIIRTSPRPASAPP